MKKFAALIILGVMFLSIAFGQVSPALSAPTDIANKPFTVHELTAADAANFALPDDGFSAHRTVGK